MRDDLLKGFLPDDESFLLYLQPLLADILELNNDVLRIKQQKLPQQ